MGSIQHDDIHNRKHYSNESGNLVVARLNGDDVKTFEVAGLASDEESWLIVLLRTREGGQIRYEWAYRRAGEELVPRSLAMNEVVAGLQSSVRETAVAVSRHIATDSPSRSAPASLLLSTSSLSQTSDEAKDEVSQRVDVEYQKLADCGKPRAYFIWKSASRMACSRSFRHGTLKICCHLQ
jgi:hypothetical protein